MSPIDWRGALGFSDRLASITRIATAYRGQPRDVAQIKAKALESECLKVATSRQIYDQLVQSHVSQAGSVPLEGDALVTADLADDVSQLLSGGITIGAYVNAHHHRDGLFSTVYKAKSLQHCPGRDSVWKGGVVALKVNQPSSTQAPHDAKKEARIMADAASRDVMPLFSAFEAKGGLFVLVMPFMSIGLDHLLRTGPLSPSRAKTILSGLMRALAHVHGKGIIHRDVKPSNILMQSANGPAVLGDFGISWSRDDPASEREDQKILDVGTTCHRPPELLFGNQRYSASLDMWAAGCVAAQVVSLGARSLFDSGDLGSDLALLKSIFETLGTPDPKTWPEASTFPDWGKMSFHEYPAKRWTEILPGASEKAIGLVSSLVRYESRDRFLASQALDHVLLRDR